MCGNLPLRGLPGGFMMEALFEILVPAVNPSRAVFTADIPGGPVCV